MTPWSDAEIENWVLRERERLARPRLHRAPAHDSPIGGYERTVTAGGVVRLKRKVPAILGATPLDDGVDDLWREGS